MTKYTSFNVEEAGLKNFPPSFGLILYVNTKVYRLPTWQRLNINRRAGSQEIREMEFSFLLTLRLCNSLMNQLRRILIPHKERMLYV